MRSLLQTLVVLLLSAAAPAPGQDAQTIREEALAAATSDNAQERREAYARLADVGLATDLPMLYSALHDSDLTIRKVAENAIWQVWGRSGDPDADRIYQVGVTQLQQGLLRSALRTFTQLVEMRPSFTEAWNKRATVHFLLENDDQSIADCDEVLKRNPLHFGALSGYGQLMLRRRELERALDYFQRALEVNPNMEGVRSSVDVLQRLLSDRRKRYI
jgi:tetratricopeptide (TPR) repeat protein